MAESFGVHCKEHLRACGAETTASTVNGTGGGETNESVYVNDKLVAVNGDENSHAGFIVATYYGGELVASANEVYAEDILIVNHTPDLAAADVGHPAPPTSTAEGSEDVFVADA